MKRLGSSDSLGALMSICPTTEVHSPGNNNNNHVYGREFQSMLEGMDEEGCMEESMGHIGEKKRRLSVEQVKALEKNFEVENKLEPERKVKLAQELGLQPRQVAVWFQNRRARWKTKQLERDYGILKANYDALKHNYDSLQHDNEALVKEIRELKSKLQEGVTRESNLSVKEELQLSESNDDNKATATATEQHDGDDPADPPLDSLTGSNKMDMNNTYNGVSGSSLFPDFKDGSSDDSDSSAILNEDNNNNNSPNANAISSSTGVLPFSSILKFNTSTTSASSPCFQFDAQQQQQKVYQPQFVKMEEHNFFGGDESCNFFSDEQAPTLQWYCPDQWN